MTAPRVVGKYGRKPRDLAKWAPTLEHYQTGTLPPAPAIVDRQSKVVGWPMFLNDQLGCCTIATVGHEDEAWSAFASTEVSVVDAEILAAYEAVGGYSPSDPSTDQGCEIADVLAYWRAKGIAGTRLDSYAQIGDPSNLPLLKQCLNVFGTVYLGVNLPKSAEQQFAAGKPWSVVKGSPIAGGHAIPLQGWNDAHVGCMQIVTWGHLQPMTMSFARRYIEEAWVPISPLWLEANGDTITGLNLAELRADLADVK